MRVFAQSGSNGGAWLATVASCAAATLLAWLLRMYLDLSNVMLLFVLTVALTAMRWGRGPALLASVAMVLCFNFFFVPPLFSLTVYDPQYLLTFSVMLAVSLIISYLSEAYRDKAIEAERRAGEATLLHELARTLSAALTPEAVAELLRAFMRRGFDADAVLLTACKGEQLHVPGDGEMLNAVELAAARGVFLSGAQLGPVAELHGGEFTTLLPLNGATRNRGVLLVHTRHVPADIGLLASVAALAATAIERLHYVEVAQASELETQSVKLRNSILAAISHDIRTPLTVLFGLADSLSGDGLPLRDTAVALRDQSYRLHRMVDNLLDMARLKSGRVELRRDWQSIPELVAASVKAISLSGRALALDWPLSLPLLRLDAMLIERVFCNLLENAVKYSPPDSSIRMGAVCDERNVRIWTENDGAFPAERLPHVFGLFERGETESAVPGVGLGLSICHTIVQAHGGSIAAENAAGGARVIVTLPLDVVPAVPLEAGDE